MLVRYLFACCVLTKIMIPNVLRAALILANFHRPRKLTLIEVEEVRFHAITHSLLPFVCNWAHSPALPRCCSLAVAAAGEVLGGTTISKERV